MRRRSIVVSAVTALLFILSGSIAPAEENVQLKEVVVTATKTEKQPQDVTQSVTVITADEIQKSGATSVAEVMSTAAGVKVNDQGPLGSLASVSLRGSTYQQVLVLLDGKRLNSASAGGFDLSGLPVSMDAIERIEIVRGPSSALYGADAVGGVVNIITKKPAESKTTLSGAMGGQGYTSTQLYNTGKDNNTYYSLSLGKDRSHGYRTNSDTDQVTAGIKIGYDFDKTSSIEATSDYTTKDIGVPGSTLFLPFSLTPRARQQDRLSITGLQYKQRLSQSFDYNVKAYESEEFLGYQDPDAINFLTGLPQPISTRSRVKTTGAEVQGNWLMTTWNVVTIGAEGRDARLTDSDAGTHSASISAAYIQDEMSFGDSFILVLGEREDHHSIFGSKSSPKASGRYLFSSGTILRASYGESFRAPTFNDLYFRDSYGDTGNPNLKPENAKEYEGGVEQSLGRAGSAKITFFERKVKDMISWSPSFPTTPVNIGRARVSGYEAETKFSIMASTSLSLNYMRLFPVDDSTGERLFSDVTNIPAMKFGGSLLATLDNNTSLSLSGERVKNYVRPGEEKWDYYSVDGKITDTIIDKKEFKTSVFLGMKNIFNRKYEVVKGYPMPPQQLYGGATMQF